MTQITTRRARLTDGLLGLVAAGGLVLGPLAALYAFLLSPCGPDSSVDVCVLAAPHATAVLLPLIGGPVAAVVSLVLAVVLRRRPPARRRCLLAGAAVVVLVVVVPFGLLALAPDSYPSPYVPRN
jgi:hypothetical protein